MCLDWLRNCRFEIIFYGYDFFARRENWSDGNWAIFSVRISKILSCICFKLSSGSPDFRLLLPFQKRRPSILAIPGWGEVITSSSQVMRNQWTFRKIYHRIISFLFQDFPCFWEGASFSSQARILFGSEMAFWTAVRKLRILSMDSFPNLKVFSVLPLDLL